MTTSRQVHPYAELFPMLAERELAELAADIKENGQNERIILDQHGRVIDGRNRLRACELAGVEPLTETREFADDAAVLRYVVSQNLHRRHLDESQRAMVAASLANLSSGQKKSGAQIYAPEFSQTDAADMLNVSRSSVQYAAKVVKEGTPELQQAVKDGDIKVSAAAAIAKKPKEEQEKEVAMRKKGKGKAKPKTNGKGTGKAKPAPAENGSGSTPLTRHLRKLTREALSALHSTSSASWSRDEQAIYLNEVLLFLDRLEA